MNPHLNSKNSLALFLPAAALLLGALLRMYHLERPLGGGDENEFLLSWAYSGLGRILTKFNDGGHQVFHTILVRLMVVWFGEENEIAIRFPAFAFGMASLWMIFLTARLLFPSSDTAHIALLLSALSPIHIYYSQTARGYCLIIFFSAAMVHALLKLLEKGHTLIWGGIFVVCMFLSVYTIPTNVYFVVGLAAWIMMILVIPTWSTEFGIPTGQRLRWIWKFVILFSLMGFLTAMSFWPMQNEIVLAAKDYYMPRVGQNSVWTLNLKMIFQVFRGPLVWVLPILIFGLIFARPFKAAYRWLPILTFITPFGIAFITGLKGFPRNYLFHFPLLIIFLAAGIERAAKDLARLRKTFLNANIITLIFVGIVSLLSIYITITDLLPSLNTDGGKNYKNAILNNSHTNDLILIIDSKHYLYAQSVFKTNLKKILQHNRLSGIKIIASDSNSIQRYTMSNGSVEISLFDRLDISFLNRITVTSGLYLFTLASDPIVGIFPEDIEANTNWIEIKGNGRLGLDNSQVLVGKSALFLDAGSQSEMIIKTTQSRPIQFKQYQLAILVWAESPIKQSFIRPMMVNPQILLEDQETNQSLVVITGKANLGIHAQVTDRVTDRFHSWVLNAALGIIPPGNYALSLRLGAPQWQKALYDGFQLFFVDLPTRG